MVTARSLSILSSSADSASLEAAAILAFFLISLAPAVFFSFLGFFSSVFFAFLAVEIEAVCCSAWTD
jgi:hypothetical protein